MKQITNAVKDNKKAVWANSLVNSLRDLSSKNNETNRANETPEAAEALSNDTTNAKYTKLRKYGLNPLRSEIISIFEFIPVASNNDSLSASTSHHSESEEIILTNVSRLIELHRQIREYITKASEKVFKEFYPDLYNNEFIDYVSSISYRSTFYKDTLNGTIENILSKMETGLTTVPRHAAKSNEFATIVKNNKRNPFLRGIIEYYIYSKIIEEIIKILANITQLDEQAKRKWSIEKFNEALQFNSDQFQNVDQDFANSFNETNLNSANLAAKIIGLKRNQGLSDQNVFCNNLIHLLSLVKCTDSINYLEQLKNTNGFEIGNDNTLQAGYSGDLASLIRTFQRINPYSMIRHLPGPDEDEYKGQYNNRPDYKDLNKDNIFDLTRDVIKNLDGSSAYYSENLCELLSTLAFDISSIYIDWSATKASGLNNSDTVDLSNLLNNFDASFQNFDENKSLKWLTKTLSIDYDDVVSSEKKELTKPSLAELETGSRNIGIFAKHFSPNDSDLVSEEKYSFLESTQNDSISSYVTGPSYFIEQHAQAAQLEEGIQKLKNRSISYLTDSILFAKDFLTMFPDYKIIASKNPKRLGENGFKSESFSPLGKVNPLDIMIEIFETFSEDLLRTVNSFSEDYDEGDNFLPIISSWVAASGDNKVMIPFGMFWGLHKYDGYTSNYPESHYSKKENYRSIGRLVEYYSEETTKWSIRNMTGVTPTTNDGGELYNSKEKFRRFMGTNGNPYKDSELEDMSEKTLGGTEQPSLTGNFNFKTVAISDIDALFDFAFGDRGDRLKKADDNKTYRLYGFTKPFYDTLMNFLGFNLSASTGVSASDLMNRYRAINGIDSASSMPGNGHLLIKYQSERDDGYEYYYSAQDGKFLSIFNYGTAAKVVIAFLWMHYFIRRHITIRTSVPSEGDFRISYWKDQFVGLSSGIKDAIKKAKGEITGPRPPSDRLAKAAYNDAYEKHLKVLEKIKKRQDMIRDSLGMMIGHASAINKIANNTLSDFSSENGTKAQKLMKDVISQNNVTSLEEIIGFSTENSHELMKNAKKKYFDIENNENKKLLLPNNLKYSIKKLKMMFKVLAEPGYGFLKSEKYGNKSLLNVGITNSMIAYLRAEARKETGNDAFINSPYISVNIFKKDQINDSLNFYPKTFIFDTSANILDVNDNEENKVSKHIKDFHKDMSLDQILKSLEITRYKKSISGQVTENIKRGYPEGIFNKDILLNHLHDYVLKEYMRTTTGIDIDESSFSMFINPSEEYDLQEVKNTAGNNEIENEYIKLLGNISKLYPEIETDSQLKSEVFRLARLLSQHLPFSLQQKFEKIITPKKFDKVYTVFLNEKDFLVSPDKDNGSYSIFTTKPQFSITCKISRPKFANTIPVSNQMKKYKKTLFENYPEVYSYYATISILPTDFIEGSEEVLNNIIETQEFNSDNSILANAQVSAIATTATVSSNFRV